jgi:hypothetical protein
MERPCQAVVAGLDAALQVSGRSSASDEPKFRFASSRSNPETHFHESATSRQPEFLNTSPLIASDRGDELPQSAVLPADSLQSRYV